MYHHTIPRSINKSHQKRTPDATAFSTRPHQNCPSFPLLFETLNTRFSSSPSTPATIFTPTHPLYSCDTKKKQSINHDKSRASRTMNSLPVHSIAFAEKFSETAPPFSNTTYENDRDARHLIYPADQNRFANPEMQADLAGRRTKEISARGIYWRREPDEMVLPFDCHRARRMKHSKHHK
jgi:hypothetical protein